MKMLFCCEFFYPSVGGVQEVMRHLALRMVSAGHEVVFATSDLPSRVSNEYQGISIQPFAISGNNVRGMTGDVDAYRRFILESDFDLIFIYAAQQWTFDAAWEVLPHVSAKKVLVPCGYSGLKDAAYRDYFQDLPAVLAQFDALVYHAKDYRDYAFGASHGLEYRAWLIPNGADDVEFSANPDTEFRSRHSIGGDELVFLTVGSLTGAKGHLEVAQAFERLDLKGKAAVLFLNGNRMPGSLVRYTVTERLQRLLGYVRTHSPLRVAKTCVRYLLASAGVKLGYFGTLDRCLSRIKRMPDRRVIVCDLPRADLVQAFFAADLFVFASYIEYSPLVLFEACAAGLPFVSVPAGNATEIVAWTGGGEICPAETDSSGLVRVAPDVLAHSIERLLDNPARLSALSAAGRQAWQERFNWSALAGEYMRVFDELSAQRQRHHAERVEV